MQLSANCSRRKNEIANFFYIADDDYFIYLYFLGLGTLNPFGAAAGRRRTAAASAWGAALPGTGVGFSLMPCPR